MDTHEPIPKGISPISRIRDFFSARSQKPIPSTPISSVTQVLEPPPHLGAPKPDETPPAKPLSFNVPITRKGNRDARMEEYEKRRTDHGKPDTLVNDSDLPVGEPEENTEPPAQEFFQGNVNLPSAFKEVIKSDQFLSVTKEDIPWLKQDENIPLVRITLKDTGEIFYYGSCIRGKLVDAAESLDSHQSDISNTLLYSHLPPLIRDGIHPHMKQVSGHVTEKPIYSFSNPQGNRVYFMRFNQINENPVIIRIAVCQKAGSGQQIVMGVLTKDSQTYIKMVGRL